MKVLRIIGRSFTNAGKSIARNFSLSMASITCTVITLILVSIGFLVSYNVNTITKDLANDMTISVFMNEEISNEDLLLTFDNLKKIDNVKKVTMKTKEEIKEEITQKDDEFSKLVSAFSQEENPFRDSFIIELEEIKDINETATTIKNLDNINKIEYGESSVNEMVKIFDYVKTGTIVLIIGLILVTAFLINNTIKITIFSRKKEIDIMRLVGTSNTVIKMPYFIEGLLIGLFGSIIPILCTIFGYSFLYNELHTTGANSIMGVIKLAEPSNVIYQISLYLLIIGTVVGMLTSVKAVRKYLTI